MKRLKPVLIAISIFLCVILASGCDTALWQSLTPLQREAVLEHIGSQHNPVVRTAVDQIGDPYRWGAIGPDRFDCSGLVVYSFRSVGKNLPHSSRALRAMSAKISADELKPGDLVFSGNPVHHVGIFVGDGMVVHAPQSGDVVKFAFLRKGRSVSYGRLQ